MYGISKPPPGLPTKIDPNEPPPNRPYRYYAIRLSPENSELDGYLYEDEFWGTQRHWEDYMAIDRAYPMDANDNELYSQCSDYPAKLISTGDEWDQYLTTFSTTQFTWQFPVPTYVPRWFMHIDAPFADETNFVSPTFWYSMDGVNWYFIKKVVLMPLFMAHRPSYNGFDIYMDLWT